MKRATLCACIDTGERQTLEHWLSKWRASLTFCSENEGCGCRVDIYNVEAPEEALAELPPSVFAASDWGRCWLA
jgi:hypothetical protein